MSQSHPFPPQQLARSKALLLVLAAAITTVHAQPALSTNNLLFCESEGKPGRLIMVLPSGFPNGSSWTLYTNAIDSRSVADAGTIPTNGLATTVTVGDPTMSNRDAYLLLRDNTNAVRSVMHLSLQKPPPAWPHSLLPKNDTLLGLITGLASGFLLSLAQAAAARRQQRKLNIEQFDTAFALVQTTLTAFWDYDNRADKLSELPTPLTPKWLTDHATPETSWQHRVILACELRQLFAVWLTTDTSKDHLLTLADLKLPR